jgi:hypothetical protein
MSVDKTSDEFKKALAKWKDYYSGWYLERLSRERIDMRELIRKRGEVPDLVARRSACYELLDRQINGRYDGDPGGRGKSIRTGR